MNYVAHLRAPRLDSAGRRGAFQKKFPGSALAMRFGVIFCRGTPTETNISLKNDGVARLLR